MEGRRRELARGGPPGMDTLLLELDTAGAAPYGAAMRAPARAPPLSRASNLASAFCDVAAAREHHPAVATKAGDVSYSWLWRAGGGGGGELSGGARQGGGGAPRRPA